LASSELVKVTRFAGLIFLAALQLGKWYLSLFADPTNGPFEAVAVVVVAGEVGDAEVRAEAKGAVLAVFHDCFSEVTV
jgi:hypothetical protein